MLDHTCTTITSVDLAHYGISRAKDWVSVDCGTISWTNQHFSIVDPRSRSQLQLEKKIALGPLFLDRF